MAAPSLRHVVATRATQALAVLGLAAVLLVGGSAQLRETLATVLARQWFGWRPAAVVLCGDSNVRALPDALLRAQWGWARTWNLGVDGVGVRRVLAQIDQAFSLQPAWLVVAVGTNDLGADDDQLLAQFDLLLTARQRAGQTRRMLVAIPLQADASRDARIHRLNAELQRRAERQGWAFVDPNPRLFAPGHDRRDVLDDAVHLSATAQQQWLAGIADRIALTPPQDARAPHTTSP